MFIKEKRKPDEMTRQWSRRTRLKVVFGALILIFIASILWVIVYDPGALLSLSGISKWPSAETQAKIDALQAQTRKQGYLDVPEFISVDSGVWPGFPICAYVGIQALDGYNRDDVITWSEMWFNDLRVPSQDVSLMIRDVERYFGPYVFDQDFQMPTSRLALELCIKRGLKEAGSHSSQSHLIRISVRNTPDHEILSYEWTYKGCACR